MWKYQTSIIYDNDYYQEFIAILCFMLYRNGITHNMNSMTVRSDASKEDIKLFCKSIVGVQFHGETSNHHSNKVKFLMAISLSFFQICCDIFLNSLYAESQCE